MIRSAHKLSNQLFRVLIAFLFILQSFPISGIAQILPEIAQASAINLPLNIIYHPAQMAGLKLNINDPLQINFLIDQGQDGLKNTDQNQEYNKLIKYFMAALTIPEDHLWVNLSPKDKDRIISDDFAKTEMGIDLLGQDYLLKKISAALLYPDNETGKKFWEAIYTKLGQKVELNKDIIDSLSRVWIVPDRAVVYEDGAAAWVVYSHLKVMTEEEYLAVSQKSGSEHEKIQTKDQQLQTQVLKENILPAIEREVNEGKTFSSLRQIYQSMILASWYKRTLKESVLGKAYVDHGKLSGIDGEDLQAKNKIYDQYLDAFKKGFYDYVREEYDPQSQEVLTRQYISGGFKPELNAAMMAVESLNQVPLNLMPAVESRFQVWGANGIVDVPIMFQTITPATASPAKKETDQAMTSSADVDPAKLPHKDYTNATFSTAVVDYYAAKQAMMVAVDTDDPVAFKTAYYAMLDVVEPLSRLTNTVSNDELMQQLRNITDSGKVAKFLIWNNGKGNSSEDVVDLRRELKGIGQKEFPAEIRKLVDTVIEEVAEELGRDDVDKKRLVETLTLDIQPYHLMSYFPESTMNGAWNDELKSHLAAALIGLTKTVGGAFASYGLFTQKINLHAEDDVLKVRMFLRHELIHYLADKGVIRIPARWENITFAVEVMEFVRHAGGTLKEGEQKLKMYGPETGYPAMAELYQRGKQMGLSGETGFMVNPAVSDRQAGYFVTEYLDSIVRSVYEQTGMNTDALYDPYARQSTEGILVAGILMGMHESDPKVMPLTLLKSFFDVLYERLSPELIESNPRIKQLYENNLEDTTRYAVSLAAGHRTLNPFHVWSDDVSNSRMNYVPTDGYPRSYDGETVEERMEAARDRMLGHAFLAISHHQNGLMGAISSLPEDMQEHPGLKSLWKTMLLPKVTKIGLEHNLTDIKSGLREEKFSGLGRWVLRVFRDRYDIGNKLVEESLYLSQPIHLQYLDSLLYMRFHHEKGKGKKDPRVRNILVDGALAESMGSLTDTADYGWRKILFYPNEIADEQLLHAIQHKIWPAYQKLFDEAVKKEEQWRAYQRKMKEEQKQAIREVFEHLSPEQLQALQQYIQNLPQEVKQAIKNAAKQMMDQLTEQFTPGATPQSLLSTGAEQVSGSPQQGQPSPGQQGSKGQRGQRPGKSQGQLSPKDIQQALDNMQKQMEGLEGQINQLGQGLGELKSKTGEINPQGLPQQDLKGQRELAKELEGKAKDIQNAAQNLQQQGRDIQQQAQNQNDMTGQAVNSLLSPEQGQGEKKLAEDIEAKTNELSAKLKELQNKVNQLTKQTRNLNNELNQPEVDGTNVGTQTRQIEDTINDIKGKTDESTGIRRNITNDLHQLQEGVQNLQQSLDQAGKKGGQEGKPQGTQEEQTTGEETSGQQTQGQQATGEESPGSQEPAGGEAGQSSQQSSTKDEQKMPDTFELPAAASMEEMLKLKEEQRRETKRIEPSEMPEPDPETERRYQEELIKNRYGLTVKEYEEYRSWERIKLTFKGQTVTVGELVDTFTDALNVLTLPTVEVDFLDQQRRGPIMNRIVAEWMGDPGRMKVIRKYPLPVYFSMIMDKSGSMELEKNQIDGMLPIQAERIISFVIIHALLNHNEIRKDRGYDPIEFELGLFASDPSETLISHETVKNDDYIKERVLYETWKRLVAGGGTQFSTSLNNYGDHLLKRETQHEETIRVMMALTDEDVDYYQKSEVLGVFQKMHEKGAHLFLVPLGTPELVAKAQAVHQDHPDYVINPSPISELVFNVFDAFAKTLPPPAEGVSWTDLVDRAMLSKSKPSPIEGYRHFFKQSINGAEYLIYKRGSEDPIFYLQRGFGGSEVPDTVLPDTDINEERIIDVLISLYKPDSLPYKAFSSDGQYFLHPIHDGLIELAKRGADETWSQFHVFSPWEAPQQEKGWFQTVKQKIRWKWDAESNKLVLSQNGHSLPVIDFQNGNLQDWIFYEEENINMMFAFNRVTNQLLILEKNKDQWLIKENMEIEQATRGTENYKQISKLQGETGTLKNQTIYAAAHLMNIEVYSFDAQPDVVVQDFTTGHRSIKAGTSGIDPALYNKVMHNGGWFVIDEFPKLDKFLPPAMKGLISGEEHQWTVKRDDIYRLETMKNHPMARIIATENPEGPGIQGDNRLKNDSPMLQRVEDILFPWQSPQHEVESQFLQAVAYAKSPELGGKYNNRWAEFEAKLKTDIKNLVSEASTLRLIFAGYNDVQILAISRDWQLLDPVYLSEKMMEDKNIQKLFENGPANKPGSLLLRPPSARILANIIRHFITFEKDWLYRPYSTIKMYYNFNAEEDHNTYNGNIIRFESHFSDRQTPPLKIDQNSFVVKDDHLRFVPSSSSAAYWDTIEVPLHPLAVIRQGRVPKQILEWIRFGENGENQNLNLFFIYQYLTFQHLEIDRVHVGDPGSGKTTFTEAMNALLNQPDPQNWKIFVTQQTRADEITFQRDIVNGETRFTPLKLPLALNDNGHGNILIWDEAPQARTGLFGIMNRVSNDGKLANDPTLDGKSRIRAPGSGNDYTQNIPGKSPGIKSFPRDFLERHVVFYYPPMPPEVMFDNLLEASTRASLPDGLVKRLNPRLIGEPKLDNTKQVERFSDGKIIYTGMLGLAQKLNRAQANDNNTLPRYHELSYRVIEKWVKFMRDRYKIYEARGILPQKILYRQLLRAYTLNGKDADALRWRRNILKIMKEEGLYDPTANGDINKDAVLKLLEGEDVIVQGLSIEREPQTGVEVLDKALRYLQTTTVGTGVERNIKVIEEKIAEMFKGDWGNEPAAVSNVAGKSKPVVEKKVTLKEKIANLDMVREVYQVVNVILDKRCDPTVGPAHTLTNKANIENLKRLMIRHLLSKEWPQELVNLKISLTELEAVKSRTGQLDKALDEMETVVFNIQFFEDLATALAAQDSAMLIEGNARLEALITELKTLIEQGSLDKRLEAARRLKALITPLKSQALLAYLPELENTIRQLEEDLAQMKARGETPADYEAELSETNSAIGDVTAQINQLNASVVGYTQTPSGPIYSAPYELPNNAMMTKLTELLKSKYANGKVTSLIPLEALGWDRIIAIGYVYDAAGKIQNQVLDIIIDGDNVYEAPLGEDIMLKNYILEDAIEGTIKGFVYTFNEQKRFLITKQMTHGGWEAREYISDERGFTLANSKAGLEGFLSRRTGGIIDIANPVFYTVNGQERFIITDRTGVGRRGKVKIEYFVNNKGKLEFVTPGTPNFLLSYLQSLATGLGDYDISILPIQVGTEQRLFVALQKEDQRIVKQFKIENGNIIPVDEKDEWTSLLFDQFKAGQISASLEDVFLNQKQIVIASENSQAFAFGQDLIQPTADASSIIEPISSPELTAFQLELSRLEKRKEALEIILQIDEEKKGLIQELKDLGDGLTIGGSARQGEINNRLLNLNQSRKEAVRVVEDSAMMSTDFVAGQLKKLGEILDQTPLDEQIGKITALKRGLERSTSPEVKAFLAELDGKIAEITAKIAQRDEEKARLASQQSSRSKSEIELERLLAKISELEAQLSIATAPKLEVEEQPAVAYSRPFFSKPEHLASNKLMAKFADLLNLAYLNGEVRSVVPFEHKGEKRLLTIGLLADKTLGVFEFIIEGDNIRQADEDDQAFADEIKKDADSGSVRGFNFTIDGKKRFMIAKKPRGVQRQMQEYVVENGNTFKADSGDDKTAQLYLKILNEGGGAIYPPVFYELNGEQRMVIPFTIQASSTIYGKLEYVYRDGEWKETESQKLVSKLTQLHGEDVFLGYFKSFTFEDQERLLVSVWKNGKEIIHEFKVDGENLIDVETSSTEKAVLKPFLLEKFHGASSFNFMDIDFDQERQTVFVGNNGRAAAFGQTLNTPPAPVITKPTYGLPHDLPADAPLNKIAKAIKKEFAGYHVQNVILTKPFQNNFFVVFGLDDEFNFKFADIDFNGTVFESGLRDKISAEYKDGQIFSVTSYVINEKTRIMVIGKDKDNNLKTIEFQIDELGINLVEGKDEMLAKVARERNAGVNTKPVVSYKVDNKQVIIIPGSNGTDFGSQEETYVYIIEDNKLRRAGLAEIITNQAEALLDSHDSRGVVSVTPYSVNDQEGLLVRINSIDEMDEYKLKGDQLKALTGSDRIFWEYIKLKQISRTLSVLSVPVAGQMQYLAVGKKGDAFTFAQDESQPSGGTAVSAMLTEQLTEVQNIKQQIAQLNERKARLEEVIRLEKELQVFLQEAEQIKALPSVQPVTEEKGGIYELPDEDAYNQLTQKVGEFFGPDKINYFGTINVDGEIHYIFLGDNAKAIEFIYEKPNLLKFQSGAVADLGNRWVEVTDGLASEISKAFTFSPATKFNIRHLIKVDRFNSKAIYVALGGERHVKEFSRDYNERGEWQNLTGSHMEELAYKLTQDLRGNPVNHLDYIYEEDRPALLGVGNDGDAVVYKGVVKDAGNNLIGLIKQTFKYNNINFFGMVRQGNENRLLVVSDRISAEYVFEGGRWVDLFETSRESLTKIIRGAKFFKQFQVGDEIHLMVVDHAGPHEFVYEGNDWKPVPESKEGSLISLVKKKLNYSALNTPFIINTISQPSGTGEDRLFVVGSTAVPLGIPWQSFVYPFGIQRSVEQDENVIQPAKTIATPGEVFNLSETHPLAVLAQKVQRDFGNRAINFYETVEIDGETHHLFLGAGLAKEYRMRSKSSNKILNDLSEGESVQQDFEWEEVTDGLGNVISDRFAAENILYFKEDSNQNKYIVGSQMSVVEFKLVDTSRGGKDWGWMNTSQKFNDLLIASLGVINVDQLGVLIELRFGKQKINRIGIVKQGNEERVLVFTDSGKAEFVFEHLRWKDLTDDPRSELLKLLPQDVRFFKEYQRGEETHYVFVGKNDPVEFVYKDDHWMRDDSPDSLAKKGLTSGLKLGITKLTYAHINAQGDKFVITGSYQGAGGVIRPFAVAYGQKSSQAPEESVQPEVLPPNDRLTALNEQIAQTQARLAELKNLLGFEDSEGSQLTQPQNPAESSSTTSKSIYGELKPLGENTVLAKLDQRLKKEYQDGKLIGVVPYLANGQQRFVSIGTGALYTPTYIGGVHGVNMEFGLKILELTVDGDDIKETPEAERALSKIIGEDFADIKSVVQYSYKGQQRLYIDGVIKRNGVALGSAEYILGETHLRQADAHEKILAKYSLEKVLPFTAYGKQRFYVEAHNGERHEWVEYNGSDGVTSPKGDELLIGIMYENDITFISSHEMQDGEHLVIYGTKRSTGEKWSHEYVIDPTANRLILASGILNKIKRADENVPAFDLSFIDEKKELLVFYPDLISIGFEQEILSDAAITAKPADLGGIDLQTKDFNVDVTRFKKDYPMLFEMPPDFNPDFTGLNPVILNIIPAQLPLFMSRFFDEKQTGAEVEKLSLQK